MGNHCHPAVALVTHTVRTKTTQNPVEGGERGIEQCDGSYMPVIASIIEII